VAADSVPGSHDLDTLAEHAQGCKGRDLYLNSNQTVFGAGAPDVGPAGHGCSPKCCRRNRMWSCCSAPPRHSPCRAAHFGWPLIVAKRDTFRPHRP
jgi:hypothetical protein